MKKLSFLLFTSISFFQCLFSAEEELPLFSGMHFYSEAVVAVPRGLPVAPTISGEQLWQKSVEIGKQLREIEPKICWKDRDYVECHFYRRMAGFMGNYVGPALGIAALLNPEPGSKLVCAGLTLVWKGIQYIPSGHPQDEFVKQGQAYLDFLKPLENKTTIKKWQELQTLKRAYNKVEMLETLTGNVRDSITKLAAINEKAERPSNYDNKRDEKDQEEINDFKDKDLYPHVEICHRVAQYLRHKESLRNESE